MNNLSLGIHELESPDGAAKKIRRSPGSLAMAIVALLAMGVATHSIGMSAQGKPDDPPAKFGIRTLSTHADRVSGGGVLVEIRVPNAKLPLARDLEWS